MTDVWSCKTVSLCTNGASVKRPWKFRSLEEVCQRGASNTLSSFLRCDSSSKFAGDFTAIPKQTRKTIEHTARRLEASLREHLNLTTRKRMPGHYMMVLICATVWSACLSCVRVLSDAEKPCLSVTLLGKETCSRHPRFTHD